MEGYEKLLDNLCRDIILRELTQQGVPANEALKRYQNEPELKEGVQEMASIHVKNAINFGKGEETKAKFPSAAKIGPGLYRLSSSRRNPVTGRFDR